MAVETAANPLDYDFTLEACAKRGQQPLFIGGTVAIRLQERDEADDPVSLTGATITLVLSDGVTDITRTSAQLISGSTYKVKADTDQSAEDVSDPLHPTGKGWYQCNFLPAETELAPLIPSGTRIGRRITYYTMIEHANGTVVKPHFMGKIDIGS
jgi:hypothetical protein